MRALFCCVLHDKFFKNPFPFKKYTLFLFVYGPLTYLSGRFLRYFKKNDIYSIHSGLHSSLSIPVNI